MDPGRGGGPDPVGGGWVFDQAAAGPGSMAGSVWCSSLGSHCSQLGRYQFQSPRSFMLAGSRMPILKRHGPSARLSGASTARRSPSDHVPGSPSGSSIAALRLWPAGAATQGSILRRRENRRSVQSLRPGRAGAARARARAAACPGFWLAFSRRRLSLPSRARFGSQRSARGRVDALMTIVPADAIPRRGVGGSLTEPRVRRACRLRRPCSPPIVRPYAWERVAADGLDDLAGLRELGQRRADGVRLDPRFVCDLRRGLRAAL